ncbi:hypothetical protein OG746_43495 [Streptomyces sp. NBC_01016]|uniref:hypothetical protein n=1 Tax=Streptomyces sp. NBC_01016 TaxID=2903720 RepID=UPI00225935E7|nr:hypothetical protein [Streptomyces sp. NBC_01016]MCX4835574.1 hypothetical protein [Streptomyces sp. NBC_01016]
MLDLVLYGPEDPLVGPLRSQDLRRLAPGESFDPTTGAGCAWSGPFNSSAVTAIYASTSEAMKVLIAKSLNL